MIDIWLVLCQMVPFVEVILLTAMEYNREGKERRKKRKNTGRRKAQKRDSTRPIVLTVKPMEYYENKTSDEEGETNISTGTHWCRGRRLKQLLPRLKTIGKFSTYHLNFLSRFNISYNYKYFQRGKCCLLLCWLVLFFIL